MRLLTLFGLAVVANGCGSGAVPDTNRTLAVGEVLESIHALDGKTVRVEGYMPVCGGYDCGLFSSRQAHAEFGRIARDRNGKEESLDFLSIGYDEDFDRKAEPLAGRYVIVTGRVSDKCRDSTGKPLCLDRAPDIVPISIAAAKPKQPDADSKSG